MIAVGLLGEYVAKIFEESKGRPLYVVADTWNLGEPKAPGDVETSGSTTNAGNAPGLVAGGLLRASVANHDNTEKAKNVEKAAHAQ